MTSKRLTAFLLGVVLALASGSHAATTGGFPSRPKFQSVGVGVAAPTSAGQVLALRAGANFDARGTGSGSANSSFLQFTDSGAVRKGYVGDASGAEPDIYVACDQSPCDIELVSTGAGTVNANGSAVCTANGTNCPSAAAPSTGTFTITWDDACTTSPTSVVDWVAVGNLVTWVFRSASGFPCTSDSVSTATSSAIIPVAIRPATSIASNNMFAGFTNNGTLGFGCLSIFSTGTVQASFASTGSCGTWTNSGSKAIVSGMTFSYIINDP
jgi:hypothetical protein